MPMTEPTVGRPFVEGGYGIPSTLEGALPWSWADEQLAKAIVVWVSTVRPDGRPHAMPTWAAWLDGMLWFEGSPTTRRARNLAANRNAVATVHIDDDAALIVEGVMEDRRDPEPELAARLVEAYGKYKATRWAYEADPENWRHGGLWALRPTVAFGWTRFPGDATRWRFAGAATESDPARTAPEAVSGAVAVERSDGQPFE
jgi:hypothetical protein